jgi:hypothetical protein
LQKKPTTVSALNKTIMADKDLKEYEEMLGGGQTGDKQNNGPHHGATGGRRGTSKTNSSKGSHSGGGSSGGTKGGHSS